MIYFIFILKYKYLKLYDLTENDLLCLNCQKLYEKGISEKHKASNLGVIIARQIYENKELTFSIIEYILQNI